MGDRWPSGIARLELLAMDDRDRDAICSGLRWSLMHTKRAQEKCVENREYAFKFNRSKEAHWKAQHEAYQRGINRLQRLIAIFERNEKS